MRDCENCKHYVEKVEVGKGSSPEHYFGCDSWECEFEPTTKNDLGVDAVSRQAVLELIADYDLSMGQVVKGIHALLPVTPQEPRWIPVSERLPETEYGESDSVLVCFENETQDVLYFDGSNWRYPTGEIYISVNHKNGWHNKVVAWMPLPKPHREVEE